MLRSILVLLTALGVLAVVATAEAQSLPADAPIDAWGPSGTVRAVARSGHTLYVGGAFDYVGPATGPLAVFDGVTGALVPGPVLGGNVDDVLALPDGGWIVAGFLDVPGSGSRGLLRLDAAGAIVPGWFVTLSGTVSAIATDGTSVFLGGSFLTVNGTSREGVAAIDVASGGVLPWAPVLSRSVGVPFVRQLLVHQGTLFVAGEFETSQGQPAPGFTALDVQTAALRPIDAIGLNGVSAMAASGDSVYLVGTPPTFPTDLLGGSRIALSSGQVTPWNPPSTLYPIAALAATPQRVFAATSQAVVSLDPATAATVGAPVTTGVFTDAIAVGGGTLYVAGRAFQNGSRYVLAGFDSTTAAPRAWSVTLNGPAFTLAASGARVAAAGPFSSAGGVTRANLYALDLRTGRPTSFAPVVSGSVNALATIGDVVVIGGSFSGINSRQQTALAAFTSSGQLYQWAPLRQGTVTALATSGRSLLIGGAFTVLDGVSRPNLAEVDLASAAVTPWLPLPDAGVEALALTGDRVLAVGDFVAMAAAARGRGAALPSGSVRPDSWDPEADNRIHSVAVAGGRIAVAGNFSTLKGQPALGFGVFDGVSGARVPFAPPSSVGHVQSVAGLGGQFAVGGFGLAILTAQDGLELGWSPPLRSGSTPGSVDLVARYADYLIAAGRFTTAGGRAAHNLAIFPSAGPPPPSQLRARVTGSQVALAWSPAGGSAPQSYVLDVTQGTTSLGPIPVAGTSIAAVVGTGIYSVRVRAVVDGVNGAPSAPMTLAVPAPAAAPPAPSGLAVTASGGFLRFTWTAGPPGGGAGNLESYVIEARPTPLSAPIASVDTGVLDTSFTAAAPPGTYYVTVRARNTFGQSAASNQIALVVP